MRAASRRNIALLLASAFALCFLPKLQAQDSRLRLSGSGLSALAYQTDGRLVSVLARERRLSLTNDSATWGRSAAFADFGIPAVSPPVITNLATLSDQSVWEDASLERLTDGTAMLLLAHSSGDLYALIRDIREPASNGIVVYRRKQGAWTRHTPPVLANSPGSDVVFEACVGSDALHIAFYVENADPTYELQYARVPLSDLSGSVQREKIADLEGVETAFNLDDFDDSIDLGSHAARNLGIATGADGAVHIVYSPGREKNPIPGGTEVRSSLCMATKLPGGIWITQALLTPGSGFGDYGGLGASIAMAPNGQIGVAASVIPRAPTGSPGRASLVFAGFFRGETPSWTTVDYTATGYKSGDGQQGTGLFPKLAFDSAGRAHIAYTDHASEHKPWAKSYSGQLRYARQNAALSGWELFTPVSSGGITPMDFQVFHPALAVRGDGTAFVAANIYTWRDTLPRGWQVALFAQQITPQMQAPPPYVEPPPVYSSGVKKKLKKKPKAKAKPKAKTKPKKGKRL